MSYFKKKKKKKKKKPDNIFIITFWNNNITPLTDNMAFFIYISFAWTAYNNIARRGREVFENDDWKFQVVFLLLLVLLLLNFCF